MVQRSWTVTVRAQKSPYRNLPNLFLCVYKDVCVICAGMGARRGQSPMLASCSVVSYLIFWDKATEPRAHMTE